MNRALMVAVASCFTLTGCPDKTEPPKPKTTAAVAAVPAAATPKPAETPAQVAQAPSRAAPAALNGNGGSKGDPCTKSKCDVHITVTKCDGSNHDIKATPDPIWLAKGNKAKIEWIIDSAGYSFTANGIGWKTAAGKNEFEDRDPGARQYKWKNKDLGAGGKWDYWIELVGPDKKTCKKDPTVVNGVVVELSPVGAVPQPTVVNNPGTPPSSTAPK